ncbi:MAG: endo-1,4-beta-xylanase [Anaerolineaceae bacterium]|nr:endo-1,4-beta-xylanase [Anaerolineaceae bacterium]
MQVKSEAVLSESPDQPACQDYTYLPTGTAVEVLVAYSDYAQVQFTRDAKTITGWIPITSLPPLPSSIPQLTLDQIDWNSLVNYSTWPYYSTENGGTLFVNPKSEENSDIVTDNSHHTVSTPLRIRFNMSSTAVKWATVKLDGIDPLQGNQDWWQGVHRMDIMQNNGFYEICVRDGSQEGCNANFVSPIPQNKLFTIVFTDVNGKGFQIWDEKDQVVQTVDLTATPGLNMPEGLFPSGWFQFGTSVGPPGTLTLDHLSIETPPSGKFTSTWNTQPGLADLAKPLHILIGAELNPDSLTEIPFCAAAKHDFNLAYISAFTDANLWLGPGEYDFDSLDAQVDGLVNNGYTLYASHLVWGAYEEGVLPDWLLKGNFSREELLKILENHVKTLVSRYEDRVTFWSIANEATIRDQYPGSDFWYDHLGAEYIEKSFLWAREADADAVLVFNADNNESPRDAATIDHINRIYKQVKTLKEKGVPIDVIGMQMHLFLPWNSAVTPKKADVVATMQRYGELGVKVMITEMDVNLHQMKGSQEEKLARQTQLYADMMSACIEAGNCIAFSTWGVSDAYSWITCLGLGWQCAVYPGPMPDAAPLLFDQSFLPKPAYFAVREVLVNAQK